MKCASIFPWKSLQRTFVWKANEVWFQFHQNKANAGHFIRFFVFVCLFVCLFWVNNQQWEKRTGYSPRRRIFMWFCWKNFAGLLFCKILFFLQCWHTAFNLILRLTWWQLNNITFRGVFWAQFFGPCSLFPLEFYFLWSRPSCFI